VEIESIMQTTYRLNAQEISVAFLQSLKTLFAGQEIEIIVKPVTDDHLDETTILAQTTLAEEWESAEDQRWDNLL
jgi:hypothetical protein